MQMATSMIISPNKILVDEIPLIKVKRLNPNQNITLVSETVSGTKKWLAFGYYVADKNGEVTNFKSISNGGTFTGLQPSGLFWSGRVPGDEMQRARLIVKDVTKPLQVNISVYNNHIDFLKSSDDKVFDNIEVLCTSQLLRLYKADHVIRKSIRIGRIRATMFIPNEGKGQHPGIIDIFGSAGGLLEHRASLLASKGFCTLALAYFNFEDLPSYFTPVDLTYFEEAIQWFSSQPYLSSPDLGIVAVSMGAVIAIYMGAICNKIKAIATIAPYHTNMHADMKYKKMIYPAGHGDYDRVKKSQSGELICSDVYYQSSLKQPILPLATSADVQYMFIHGVDDQFGDVRAVGLMVDYLQKHQRNNYEVHLYQDAGHLIEPPFAPLCRASYHFLFNDVIIWGGKTAPHAEAQSDHWQKLQTFFKKHLNGKGNKVKSQL